MTAVTRSFTRGWLKCIPDARWSVSSSKEFAREGFRWGARHTVEADGSYVLARPPFVFAVDRAAGAPRLGPQPAARNAFVAATRPRRPAAST